MDEPHQWRRLPQLGPYYTVIMDRVMLTARISKAGIERIKEMAEADSVERSEMVRRMLAFAARNMPRGWTPGRSNEASA